MFVRLCVIVSVSWPRTISILHPIWWGNWTKHIWGVNFTLDIQLKLIPWRILHPWVSSYPQFKDHYSHHFSIYLKIFTLSEKTTTYIYIHTYKIYIYILYLYIHKIYIFYIYIHTYIYFIFRYTHTSDGWLHQLILNLSWSRMEMGFSSFLKLPSWF